MIVIMLLSDPGLSDVISRIVMWNHRYDSPFIFSRGFVST